MASPRVAALAAVILNCFALGTGFRVQLPGRRQLAAYSQLAPRSQLVRSHVRASDDEMRSLRTSDDDDKQAPAAGEERRASTEPAFKLTDLLTALPYALGLVSISILALSQQGVLDDWKPFGDIEIPAWMMEE